MNIMQEARQNQRFLEEFREAVILKPGFTAVYRGDREELLQQLDMLIPSIKSRREAVQAADLAYQLDSGNRDRLSEMNTARHNLAVTNQLASSLWLELRRDTDVSALRQQAEQVAQQQLPEQQQDVVGQATDRVEKVTKFLTAASSLGKAVAEWSGPIAGAFRGLLG